MITEQQAREYRKYCKKILNYEESRKRMECNMGSYFYHNYKLLDLDPENFDKIMESKYKAVFKHAWRLAEKYFRNAEAAEILDIDDSINDTLHTLRLRKKECKYSFELRCYEDAINIVKELKAKLPKRMIRL